MKDSQDEMTQAIEKPPAKQKKDWKALRTVRLLVLSATQIETYQLCKRKWWLKYIRKLEDPTTSSQGFGTVLHSVVERFLRADALGRDPQTGAPVDLYPAGWMHPKNRRGDDDEKAESINDAEAAVIRMLVDQAIESGILQRLEDTIVEYQLREDLVWLPCSMCEGSGRIPCPVCDGAAVTYSDQYPNPCPSCVERQGIYETCPLCNGDGKGDHVQFVGLVDYIKPEGIEDHKSTKNMKYAKSKKDLQENAQMLIYAKVLIEIYKQQNRPLPDKISLRHNVFCKDPNDLRVRKTEAFVTPEQVEEHWQKMQIQAAEMSQLRRVANGWHECPPPESMAHACNAYGGCPFRQICAGKESEEMYEKRLDRQQEMSSMYGMKSDTGTLMEAIATTYAKQKEQEALEKGSLMGLLDSLKTKNPSPSLNPGPAQRSPAQQTQQQQAPALEEGESGPPPWAMRSCKACKGLGFDSKGNPCRICDIYQAKAKPQGFMSGLYDITPMDDGTAIWQLKTDPTIMGVSPMVHSEGVTATESVQQAPAVTQAQQNDALVQRVATATQKAEAIVQQVVAASNVAPVEEAKETRGRPPKGFTLIINGVVSKGGGRSVTMALETFKTLQEGLSKAAGEGRTYHDLDAFKRRDEIAKVAKEVAADFKTDFVCADIANGTPDFKAFVESIRPFASMEIVCTN